MQANRGRKIAFVSAGSRLHACHAQAGAAAVAKLRREQQVAEGREEQYGGAVTRSRCHQVACPAAYQSPRGRFYAVSATSASGV